MAAWEQSDRERAYTAICEAITAAGREHETMFFARLTLLITEELADMEALMRCLSAAGQPILKN